MENQEKIDLKLSQDGISVDWFLQKLVALANGQGLEFGVTLYVNGQIISGTLISGKQYFETFGDLFSDAWPYENKEVIKDGFLANAEIYKKQNHDDPTPPSQYVHLKDTRIITANGNLPSSGNAGVLWRGKINSASGFNLGKFD